MRTGFVAMAILAPLLCGTAAAAGRHHPNPSDSAAATKRTPEKAFPFDNTWVLTSINGKAPSGEPPSFSIDTTLRASGFAGCNTFSMALYPIKDQKLASGAIAMTHKSCDKALMLSERAFLVGLHSLPKWDMTPEGTLVVTAPTGTMLFRRGV